MKDDTETTGQPAPAETNPPESPEHKPETTTAVKKKRKASKAERQQKSSVVASGKAEFDGARTVEDLVARHNEMVLTGADFGLAHKPVKTFADVKTGVLACERLHANIEKARATTETNTTEDTMKKARKSGSARKAVRGKTKAAKTTKTGRTRARFPMDAKIVAVKGAKITAREGSGRRKRIDACIASSGKTVGDWLKKGKTGTLSFCVKNKLVRVEGGGKAA
jgi:hypothetical protein